MNPETVKMIEEMDPPFHEFMGEREGRCVYPNCGVRWDRAVHSRETAASIGAEFDDGSADDLPVGVLQEPHQ